MKKIQISLSLVSVALLAACSTTSQTTAQRPTLEQRLNAKYASNAYSQEPAPPAEGPEDVPASGPNDVDRNPNLVPTPLLRLSAAGGTP
jgi:hypothetical protein